jgi:hypothetical protein
MLQKYKLDRFPYLVAKGQSVARRYMLQSMQIPSLKWAPRDCSKVSATYDEFRQHGFDSYEVALSLVGCGKTTKTPASSSFAQSHYTYLHMPFRQLAGFLTELHPDDRFIAYVMTEATAPVHMYFDIDADLDKFPHLSGADEECLRVFMAALRDFFQSCFHRALDVSGLLLLQATSATKLSWHLHIRSESFRDITRHRLFVELFREWLEQQQELTDAEAEAAPEAELDAVAKHRALPLCCFKATDSQSREGQWQHIVDHQPYSRNQNLRAPYNRKPGKTALRVRTYEWDEYGELRVLGDATDSNESEHMRIDPEVLFQAHPSLAQPSDPDYVPLVVNRRGGPQKRGQKRAARDAGWDEDCDDGPEAAVSGRDRSSNTYNGRRKPKWKNEAVSEGKQTALTDSEKVLVRVAVAPHLGADVMFDEVYRTSTGSSVDSGGLIRGTTTSGTSKCPILRVRQPQHTSMKHRSNRMCFTLGAGWLKFHCFDEDCRAHDQTVSWTVDAASLRLLIGADDDESDGDAQCKVLAGALLTNTSIGGEASVSPAAAAVASPVTAAVVPRAPDAAVAVSIHRIGLHEGWTDGSSSSLARICQLEHEALHSHQQEEEDERLARQRYEQQVRETDEPHGRIRYEETEEEKREEKEEDESRTSGAEALAMECDEELPTPAETVPQHQQGQQKKPQRAGNRHRSIE